MVIDIAQKRYGKENLYGISVLKNDVDTNGIQIAMTNKYIIRAGNIKCNVSLSGRVNINNGKIVIDSSNIKMF